MQFTLSSCLSDLASPNKLHAQFSESERASGPRRTHPSSHPWRGRWAHADGTGPQPKPKPACFLTPRAGRLALASRPPSL